ncbi:glycosyltransferase family 2 protein [Naumannella halotolerans]|uniref:glycosyltransferase family 2 protein n=1 Tax=Naumannella halotolerans TaxID=993414 RepID=UPI00370CFD4F
MILLSLLATFGVLAYATFLLNPDNRGDLLPYLMVIIAEAVIVFHIMLAMCTILAGAKGPRDEAFWAARTALFDGAEPSVGTPMVIAGHRVAVDVFITTYGEPVEILRRTVLAARDLRGEHLTWVLDDGHSDEVRAMAAELGVRYVRRLSSGGAKAGNINHALSLSRGEFFCIFDADFVPDPEFLVETVPFFVDQNVAFVQTPQVYGNMHSFIARGAGYMQSVFYRFIQPGRNHFNAAFCVGTNVIFRRAAINDVGGMYTGSKSEDVWTSLMLHERGWRTIYISDPLAVGDAPETIEDYTRQQTRWATGGFEILLNRNPLSPRVSLTLDQRLMYLVTATHYMTGLAPGILLFVPALEIYLDLRPMDLSISVASWLLFYCGLYGMQILLAAYTVGSFRWEVLTLAAVSFPIYGKALINAFLGRDQKWHVTGSAGRRSSPFNFIQAQVAVLVFLLVTSAVAVWRDTANWHLTLATIWNVINTLIILAFVILALRESSAMRREARIARREARKQKASEPVDPESITVAARNQTEIVEVTA